MRLSDAVAPQKMLGSFELLSISVGQLADRMKRAALQSVDTAKNKLALNASKLETMNPLSVLSRGYSILERGGVTVKSVAEIKEGENLSVRLSDGKATVTVLGKSE